MTKRVLGKGYFKAKLANDLVPGDIIVRPCGEARVTGVIIGIKSVFLRLAGRETAYSVNIYKRRQTKVAVTA